MPQLLGAGENPLMKDDRHQPALEGETLEDEWEENPDPPPDYAKPSPHLIVEKVAGSVWVWHSMNKGERIRFDGDAVRVKQ